MLKRPSKFREIKTMTIFYGVVKIWGPSFVIAIVCSKWAERKLSMVS